MRRSSIITRFAIESGYMDEKKAKLLEREYQQSSESNNLTFESWAITKGHLKIEQAKSLLVTIASSRFMCTSCGTAFLGKELIGGTEYRCPDCNGQDFLLQSKAKSADDKISKAPKLMTPPEGVDKEDIDLIDFDMNNTDEVRQDTTGLGSFLTDSVIESDVERAKREIEEIENESQKALKKAVFSKIPQKKLSEDEASQRVEFTAEMMDRGLPPGALLDGIKIEKIIGRGGIGIVYKGLDLTLERPVALKVLNSDVLSDKAQVERFGIEARSMAQLEHPNVVQVYKFGEKFGRPYLSMQWVDGENIGQKIDKVGALSIPDCLYWFIQTARGLLEAHNHGIIHRDVKPDNIIVNSKGKVKIVDFGLAKQVVKAEHIGLSDPRFVLGTPAYIAPEQALGEEIDNRTDIYSFAISMFHALTGKLPFTGSPAAVVHQHISTPLPYIREYMPRIPEELNRLIKVMSSKNMENRPNDMAEIVSKLEQILFDFDPEYASHVNIAPKYDSIMGNNKKILAGSNEVLAVYDESDEDTGSFTASQEAHKLAQENVGKMPAYDNSDTTENPLSMQSIDLFDEIENTDIFNTTQNDFSADDIEVFSPQNFDKNGAVKNSDAESKLNKEIQQIRDEINKSADINEGSDSFFDNDIDAFEDLQVEVLESERSAELEDFELMREQLKNESIDLDDGEDTEEEQNEHKPLDEIEYTEESDVVIAEEDDILVTGKLQSDAVRRFEKTNEMAEDEEDSEEGSKKIKLQVAQSFVSRAHKDDDPAKPGVASISAEEAEKLMQEHKKLKSPKSVSVKRIIPTVSVFIIVFILSFSLFLALTTNKPAGVGKSNNALKTEEVQLINMAQACLIEKNGTNAKYILSLMDKLIKKNKDYNFSTDFQKNKSDLVTLIREYDLEQLRERGVEFSKKDYRDYSSSKAKEFLKELEKYMDENTKLADEFSLGTTKSELKQYIKTRMKKEADEAQISEFLKTFKDVDITDLKQLYNIKKELRELLNYLPDYKNDDRLKRCMRELEDNIGKTPEKQEFDRICNQFKYVHVEGKNVDLASLTKEFEGFLEEHPVFEKGDERVDNIRAKASELKKIEEKMIEDLKAKYKACVQAEDGIQRKKMIRELVIMYREYSKKVPRVSKDATLQGQYAWVKKRHEVDKALQTMVEKFKEDAGNATSITVIDQQLKNISEFLSVNDDLWYLLDETITMLKNRKADFIRKAEEEKLADEYKTQVDDLLKRLELDKSVVSEGEKILEVMQNLIDKELKFTEKFNALVVRLKNALRHERLVLPPDYEGSIWQAEKIKIDKNIFKLRRFDYENLPGHNSEVTVVTFDKDKKLLMTCDKSGIVKVYIYKTFEEIRSFRVFGNINDAVFTDKPEYAVFALSSGNLELWNIALREKLHVIKQFEKGVLSLAYQDGNVFCAGANNDVVQISMKNIYDSKQKPSFEEVHVYSGSRTRINSIALSPDKKLLAAGSSDCNVYVWQLDNPTSENFVLKNHTAAVTNISFNEDSMSLLSSSEDEKISIWSVASRLLSRDFKPMLKKRYKAGVYITSKKVILYSDRLDAYGLEGQIEIVDIDNPSKTEKIDNVFGGVKFMELNTIDKVKNLFCTKNDGSILIYQENSDDRWIEKVKTDFVVASEMLGNTQIFSIYKSGKVRLATISGEIIYETSIGRDIVNCASISTKRRKAVIGTNKGNLVYLDIVEKLDKAKPSFRFVEKFKTPITAVALKNDGSKVIVGLKNETAYIYDSVGRQSAKLPGLNGATEFAAVNSIDTRAIFGIRLGFLTAISLPGGEVEKDIGLHYNVLSFVDFNKIDPEKTDEFLFIGYTDRNGKNVLVKYDTDTQNWSQQVLVNNLEAKIISLVEISKTRMLVAFDNGAINCYDHNLYDHSNSPKLKFSLAGSISFSDLSAYAIRMFVSDKTVYVQTSKGSIITLDVE